MGKRRWNKRLSAAVLAAILAVNCGGVNISARADMVSAVEESIQAEAKGLTTSPSDAEKTENPESTKIPEISAAAQKTGSTMYADASENIVYTIRQATGGFSVNGGAHRYKCHYTYEGGKENLRPERNEKGCHQL